MLCLGRSRGQNPRGLRPLGFWPWDLPRHNIHHGTSSAFSNNVPLYTVHCVMYIVHCTLYNVHCSRFTIHFSHQLCTLFSHITIPDNFSIQSSNQLFHPNLVKISTQLFHAIFPYLFDSQNIPETD